jgi:O-antigen ligase
VRATTWRRRIPLILLLAISTFGVIISFARTIYVGTLFGLFLLFWLSDSKQRWNYVKLALGTLTTAAAVLIPILQRSRVLALLAQNYLHRFTSSTNLRTDRSLMSRYVEWDHIWKAITDSPLLGQGFGAVYTFFNILTYSHEVRSYSHSSYLYILFKTGIIGGALFFGVFGIAIAKAWMLARDKRSSPKVRLIAQVCFASLIAFLIDCQTAPVLVSKTDSLWIGIIFGFLITNFVTSRRVNAINSSSPVE